MGGQTKECQKLPRGPQRKRRHTKERKENLMRCGIVSQEEKKPEGRLGGKKTTNSEKGVW